MAFSESFELGNSTFLNIDKDVLNALKNAEEPRVLDVIEESPTNSKNKSSSNRSSHSKQAAQSQYSFKRRKKFRRSKSDTAITTKVEKTYDEDVEQCKKENYSDFFKSDFSLPKLDSVSSVNISQIEAICQSVESTHPRSNAEIAASPVPVDLFDDSGGFSQLLQEKSLRTTPQPETEIDFFADSAGFSELLQDVSKELRSIPSAISRPTEPIFSEDMTELFEKEFDEAIPVKSPDPQTNEVDEVLNIDDTSFFVVGIQNNDAQKIALHIELEESRKEVSLALQEEVPSSRKRSRMPIHTPNNLSTCEESVLRWVDTEELLVDKDSNNLAINDNLEQQEDSKVVNNYKVNDNLEELKNITAWSLPSSVLQEYEKKGIRKMFDWQVECLSNPKVLFEHKNLVYSAPTSAGKTLVSEILMIKTVLERNKKVIMILPFISVVREKMFYLQDLLTPSGYRVEGFFGGYVPPGGFESINVAICTIEKANSIINKLLEQGKLGDIGIVVVDEIHLISDPGRGYILELLIAKILYMSQKYALQIQIVTMSATLANVELLKKWLDAELYITNYRPVELQEMIKIGTKIFDKEFNLVREINSDVFRDIKDQDHVVQLSLETIMEGCSVVIFCPSKDWCENLCLQLAQNIHNFVKLETEEAVKVRSNIRKDVLDALKEQMKDIPTGLDAVLSKTITYGCAFHHAGLTTEERDTVEAGFKNGALKIIVATSTLSSGVNLPARRVIIRSPLFAGKQMNSLTYKQMIGRAGRTGKDILGESILICPESNAKVGKDLISADLKPITSCLEMENSTHLKRALLEVISASVATTQDDIDNFVKCTLLSVEKNCEGNDNTDLSHSSILESINFLKEYEFIRLQMNEDLNEMNYVATRLGMACLASSMPPSDGLILFAELQKSRRCFVLESELHAVYLVTPYSVCYQMSAIDWLFYLDLWEKLNPAMKKVGELVGVKESFLVRAMRGQTNLDYKLMQIHKRFYTALALQELVNETPISTVALKFKCPRGLLQTLQQMASTFAGIVTAFCNSLNFQTLSLIVSQFKERLFFGVHRDLIDLIRLPGLNYKRARYLFDAGIENLVDLANADIFALEKILHDSLSFDSAKKHDHEDEFEANMRNQERILYITGKSGLTVKEAARMLVDDARKFVQYEIGVQNINWSMRDDRGTQLKRRSTMTSTEASPPKAAKLDNKTFVSDKGKKVEREEIVNINIPNRKDIPNNSKVVASKNKRDDIERLIASKPQKSEQKPGSSKENKIELQGKSKELQVKKNRMKEKDVEAKGFVGKTNQSNPKDEKAKQRTCEANAAHLKPPTILKVNLLETKPKIPSKAHEASTSSNKNQKLEKEKSPSCIQSSDRFKTPLRPSSKPLQPQNNLNICGQSSRSSSTSEECVSDIPFLSSEGKRDNEPRNNHRREKKSSTPLENNRRRSLRSNDNNCDSIELPRMCPPKTESPKKGQLQKQDAQLLDDTSFEMDTALQNALDTSPNRSTEEIASSQTLPSEHRTQNSRLLRSARSKREDKTKSIEISDLSLENSIILHPLQMNSSHIMSSSKIEQESASFDRIEIVNICGSLMLFKNAMKEIGEADCFGLSIAVEKHLNKRKPLIGGNLLINQINEGQSSEKKFDFPVNEDSYVAGISICLSENVVYFLNMQSEGTVAGLTRDMKLDALKVLFSANIVVKIYEAKEQLKALRRAIPELPKFVMKIQDPKVASWLLQPDKNLNLHGLAQQFAPECTSLTNMVVKNRGYSSIGLDCNIGMAGKVRSAIESCVTIHILQSQLENLERIGNGKLLKFFNDLEMPIQMSLYLMECIGFAANDTAFRDLFQQMMETMKSLETKIFELHGSRFNLGSTSAVARVLGLHKKANGRYSTTKQILEKIDSPMSLLILDHRKLSVMLSKTTQPLLKCIKNGRIFGESVSFTSTGRITMHEPNLQCVAKDFYVNLSGEKRLVSCRSAFSPPSGRCLLSSDFCQMEMRILAHLTQDKALLQAMNSDTDVFTSISAKWNKIPEDEVSESLRNGTKQLCYGIIYGMGLRSLAEALKCTEQEAAMISEQFHTTYPGIRRYIDKVVNFAKHNGYVETITGRRRYLDNITSPEPQIRSQAERQAVNTTIQGSAADITKSAILRMEKNIAKYRKDLNVHLVLHIHDELIFEVPTDKAQKIAKVLSITMANCVKLSVPLRVKLKIGKSWGQLKEIAL